MSGLSSPRLVAGTVLGCALLAAPALRADTPRTAAGHKEVLAQSTASWNGKPYTRYPSGTPQLTVLKVTIPAHAALPWHTHPFPNAGYVLQGQLTIEDKASGARKTFQAGQAFTESVDDPHRGVAGDQDTVLILVYSGTPGEKTSVPLPGQPAEY